MLLRQLTHVEGHVFLLSDRTPDLSAMSSSSSGLRHISGGSTVGPVDARIHLGNFAELSTAKALQMPSVGWYLLTG